MMRPVSLKVGTGDVALAAGHRLNAINLLAFTPNSAAAFSIAASSAAAPMSDQLFHDMIGSRKGPM
jgi:hypothetical protein